MSPRQAAARVQRLQAPRSTARPTLPRVSEKAEQTAIVKALRLVGGQVYVVGTVRPKGDFHGTCQTPGIPDLMCFLPPPPHGRSPRHYHHVFLFVEVKARGGRLRHEQLAFAESCTAANVWDLVGDADVVLAWLTAHGYLR